MLVLMTLTHLPTRFSDPAGQPFGWVSAAEGFVFLSAFMVGRIYSDIALKKGIGATEHIALVEPFGVGKDYLPNKTMEQLCKGE